MIRLFILLLVDNIKRNQVRQKLEVELRQVKL